MNQSGSTNRTRRWLILLAIGFFLLIGPLVFMEQIEQAAAVAVETAQDRPHRLSSKQFRMSMQTRFR